jgi:hypothetical protein
MKADHRPSLAFRVGLIVVALVMVGGAVLAIATVTACISSVPPKPVDDLAWTCADIPNPLEKFTPALGSANVVDDERRWRQWRSELASRCSDLRPNAGTWRLVEQRVVTERPMLCCGWSAQ